MGSSSYNEEDYRRARKMRFDDIPQKDVANEIGCSRQTIARWEEEGVGVDEDSWEEHWEKKIQVARTKAENEALEAEVEEVRQDWKRESAKIGRALSNFTQQLEEGEIDIDVRDAETLYKLKMRMDNRSKEVNALMKRFMKKCFLAASRVLDKHEFKKLKAEIEEVEHELMTEFDSEHAEAIIEQNKKISSIKEE